ncbi:hypothetical protein EOA23_27845 [Mesorhizobium sp. M2A.F.Ca.ET.042.01.1.1]|uniref:hypothetical protein n=1 Tax=Mesorhizobium sp. M2A.F.Ca.ET.042.01.1.1 TaxID=2496745 RepID=UPI000FCB2709|nr:hypothetical protein [Mesorhizobium sp. M2A.F.Ca.ET.042.01.1.1]RUX20656.1 hypothetical protein EOA23_27845 [Mesorhizobium sp. M2A.F.Ca.ET.042.01.1.1]
MDDLLASKGIRGIQAALLVAVWKGKGLPVNTERLFDAMYADDPDGGPSPTRMYLALGRAVRALNTQLSDIGISVLRFGRNGGYRLALHP